MTLTKMDDSFIPKLKEEMKRLQQLFYKSKKKQLKHLPKSIKCGTLIKCKKGGNLQTNNISVYAQCSLCEGCEHFMCAVIKDVRRQNILNGTENFVCTVCFAKNPLRIALNKDIETTVTPLSVSIGVNRPEDEITVLESIMVTVEVEVETTEKEVETPTALVRDNEPIHIQS